MQQTAPPPTLRTEQKLLCPTAPLETDADDVDIALTPVDTPDEVLDHGLSTAEKELLQEAKSLYEQDRLYASYHSAEQLLDALTNNYYFADEDCVRRAAFDARRALETSKFFSELTRKVEKTNAVLHGLVDADGWSVYREDEHGKTWTRDESDGRRSIRVEKRIQQPIFRLLAVLGEIDLYSKWFPFMTTSREIAQLTQTHRLIEFGIDLSWPLSPRKLVLEAFAIDWTEHNSVVVHIKSIEQHPFVPLPPLDDPNSVRINLVFGGFLLQAAGPAVTNVSAVFNVDLGMHFVPLWVINSLTGKVVHWILYYMEKEADFDDESEYARRILQNPDFYSFAKEVCDRITQP